MYAIRVRFYRTNEFYQLASLIKNLKIRTFYRKKNGLPYSKFSYSPHIATISSLSWTDPPFQNLCVVLSELDHQLYHRWPGQLLQKADFYLRRLRARFRHLSRPNLMIRVCLLLKFRKLLKLNTVVAFSEKKFNIPFRGRPTKLKIIQSNKDPEFNIIASEHICTGAPFYHGCHPTRPFLKFSFVAIR